MKQVIGKYISLPVKRRIKSVVFEMKKRTVDAFFSYSYSQLVDALRRLGVQKGDVVMLHSRFSPLNGFRGTPHDVIKALREIISWETGCLLMVSLPYTSSTLEYLRKTKDFDVKRTMSRMGLISEIFRRQPGVVRSAHPTHPVLAAGSNAAWFIEGHEKCLHPCGPGSPFERLHQSNGKVLFFDVRFNSFTFIHYLEHAIQDELPFSLYEDEIFEVRVHDGTNAEIRVRTKAFSLEAVQKRRPEILHSKLLLEGRIKRSRIGLTRLMLLKVQDAVECLSSISPQYFYDCN